MPQDLTVSEILVDPLIRLVMQADRVSVHSFAKLLDEAAHRQSPRSAAGSRALRPPLKSLRRRAGKWCTFISQQAVASASRSVNSAAGPRGCV